MELFGWRIGRPGVAALTLALTIGCGGEAPTSPGDGSGEVAGPIRPSAVATLAGKLELVRPSTPRTVHEPRFRTFDRDGNVLSNRPLTHDELRAIWLDVRELFKAQIRAERQALPAPSASPGLSLAPINDTIFDFQTSYGDYTLE